MSGMNIEPKPVTARKQPQAEQSRGITNVATPFEGHMTPGISVIFLNIRIDPHLTTTFTGRL
jgi:hypothetical protein